MVQIENSEIRNKLSDSTHITGNLLPTQLGNQIIPVIDAEPNHEPVVRQSSNDVTGSVTLYTTPSDADFYLHSVVLSSQDDATSDNRHTFCQVTINGANRLLNNHRKLTTTATTANTTLTLNPPLKLDRGSNIIYANSFTVGSATKSCSITGFIKQTLEK